jgi:hypothetical protein
MDIRGRFRVGGLCYDVKDIAKIPHVILRFCISCFTVVSAGPITGYARAPAIYSNNYHSERVRQTFLVPLAPRNSFPQENLPSWQNISRPLHVYQLHSGTFYERLLSSDP